MGVSIRNVTKKINKGLAFVEDISLGISLIIIVLLIFGNVFSRFILGSPYAWPDETAKFLHVIAIYIGVAVASRRNAHLKIDLIPQYFPSCKRAFEVIGPAGGVAFSMIFVYLAYKFFAFQRMIQDRSWVTSVPIWVIALVILLTGILIFLREGERFIDSVANFKNRQESIVK